MNVQTLRFGMKVKHPAYGLGTVKTIAEHTVEIKFEDGVVRTVAPDAAHLMPAEPTAAVSGLEMPLSQLIAQTATAVIDRLGLDNPKEGLDLMGGRWNNGDLVLRPKDPDVQSKEVPIETFFHKIVMMRNNLRVLEQKINGHDKLTEEEKVELQQYITRCYGSMTTFNVLFRHKEDQF